MFGVDRAKGEVKLKLKERSVEGLVNMLKKDSRWMFVVNWSRLQAI